MRVTVLGHAGLLIQTTGGKNIVCDPWFSRTGAFLGTWHQFPQNHVGEFIVRQLDANQKIDAIYVSHEHEDHLDEDFLRSLKRGRVQLIVPDFDSIGWKRKIDSLGFSNVTRLDSFGKTRIGDAELTIVHSPTRQMLDSALVVREDSGHVLVNLNDCKISTEQVSEIKRTHPEIEILTAQFSGANWFPFCYDFDVDTRISAAEKKVENGYRRWAGYVRALDPKNAIPNAGPAAILDPSLTKKVYGPDCVFPTPDLLVDYLRAHEPALADRTRLVIPGDWIDTVEDCENVSGGWWKSDLSMYRARYGEDRADDIKNLLDKYPDPVQSLLPKFRNYWSVTARAAPFLCQRSGITVLFDITGPNGGSWLVDVPTGAVTELDKSRSWKSQCDYALTLESKYLLAILSNRMRWDDFLLSFRFWAWRKSVSSYNEDLMTIMRFNIPSDLFHTSAWLAGQDDKKSFTITKDGVLYDVSSICPHMGQELTSENYDPVTSMITCPRHGWKFHVPTGVCAEARSLLRMQPKTTI